MALVIDASVGLKWILQEQGSDLAHRLAVGSEELLVPDFWLNEACNVLWLQVRNAAFTPDEAREGFELLKIQVEPTPTSGMGLHDIALDIGFAVNHSPYDTLYVAFAIAMEARAIVVADHRFAKAMRKHPDPSVANKILLLREWAQRPAGAAPPD